ncbi:MAG: glycine cleavage system protein GcvH [Robiginitomaculum sp.]|nr:glycine cleavage system protein GcvH [Robiginitomaculum sp.]MDQ7077862.1 glycine cleavage system protein GcvH [Robiginitomaculum sp.]
MSKIYYTEDHEWLNVDGDTAIVGISTYAAGQLGDVVFVELPEVGKTVKKGEDIAVVESVKSASEIYAPVSGEITAVNEALEDAPETVNEDAQGAGWFFKMTISDAAELSGLMDEAAYGEFTRE